MRTERLRRRLGSLEAENANKIGQVHSVMVPEGLTEAEREAWIAEHSASLPPDDIVIYRTIIDPPARTVQAAQAETEGRE
jgi:hypothetical protein